MNRIVKAKKQKTYLRNDVHRFSMESYSTRIYIGTLYQVLQGNFFFRIVEMNGYELVTSSR